MVARSQGQGCRGVGYGCGYRRDPHGEGLILHLTMIPESMMKTRPHVEPCSSAGLGNFEESPEDHSHCPAVGTETHLSHRCGCRRPGPQLAVERKVTQVSLLKTAKGGETVISIDCLLRCKQIQLISKLIRYNWLLTFCCAFP